MRFNVLSFLLMLSCVCLALTQGTYDDCCLKYVTHMGKRALHVTNYRLQKTDGGCNIPAVVFIMRKGRMVCADPNENWVKELQAAIEKRNDPAPKKSKTNGHRRAVVIRRKQGK